MIYKHPHVRVRSSDFIEEFCYCKLTGDELSIISNDLITLKIDDPIDSMIFQFDRDSHCVWELVRRTYELCNSYFFEFCFNDEEGMKTALSQSTTVVLYLAVV